MMKNILSVRSRLVIHRRLLASGYGLLVFVVVLALAVPLAEAAFEQEHAAASEVDQAASPTLKPRGAAPRSELSKPPGEASSLLTTVGGLAIVLGLFLVVVWVIRRSSKGSVKLLPKEVFEVLGFAPMINRQQAVLVRCGNKLLLVLMNAARTKPFAEITDPAEVERLTDLCHQVRHSRAPGAIRQLFEQKEGNDAG